ncbi:hypothetical protein GBAR_LOCUS22670 [Geodia barretti]|uniref:SRCR domain-containing protein n=1 Tax=Geodia barretti TaxID=519541 RepID=A0AA35T3H0_GEOBA|nr:hypothetical protein GBAR_LOCUS22670 [Geodia barretti]
MMFIIVLSLMVGSRGAYAGDGHCRHTQTFPLVPDGHVVRFNSRECDTDFDHLQSHVFCEDSGWGDEEATVVCRDQLHSHYGIGGYVHIDPMEVGLQYVNCSGSEGALEECAVAATTTKTQCSQAGIIRQCLNVSQIYVSQTEDYEPFDYVEVSEGETVQFCLIVWGPISEMLRVLVETTNHGYAVANFDYRPLRQTVTFEPTESLRSQQCLKIELIDDSLAEFWEIFSVTISTNSSTVNLTRREFNVYVRPDDGQC